MSSDEEFDYMSDKFVVQIEKNDLRPGLIYGHSDKRKHTILKKKMKLDEENKTRYRPYAAIERERREEGLKVAISSDNKGYALLQKMGYQPGTGIGKSGTGNVDPIKIEVKCDREGLGRKEALKAIEAEKIAIRSRIIQRSKQLLNVEDYQLRMSKERAEKQLCADLRRSQRVCKQLDGEKGYEEAAEPWFWPEELYQKDESQETSEQAPEVDNFKPGVSCAENDVEMNDEDEVEYETSDKLKILTMYLRKTHFYCLWCGNKYNDVEDLQDNCPGNTRDDH